MTELKGAGMTELFCAGMTGGGRGVAGVARAGMARKEAGTGLGAALGEIPAAERGYDGAFCAGMTELFARV